MTPLSVGTSGGPLRLADLITSDRILSQMTASNKNEAINELASLVGGADSTRVAKISEVLLEREKLASTGIGEEIAIPHGKLDALPDLVLALGRKKEGLDFEAIDGKLTRLFFVLVGPLSSTNLHLKALARISRLCKEPVFRRGILEAKTNEEMFEVLRLEDEKHLGR